MIDQLITSTSRASRVQLASVQKSVQFFGTDITLPDAGFAAVPAGDTLRLSPRRFRAQIVDIRLLSKRPAQTAIFTVKVYRWPPKYLRPRGFKYLIDHPVQFAAVHCRAVRISLACCGILRHNKRRPQIRSARQRLGPRKNIIDARMAVRRADHPCDVNPPFGANQRQPPAKAIFTRTQLFSVSLHIFAVRELVHTTHSPSRKILNVEAGFGLNIHWSYRQSRAVILMKVPPSPDPAAHARTDIHVGLLARLLGKRRRSAHPGQPAGHLLRCADRRCVDSRITSAPF